jgi:hypothetical protein
MEQLENNTVVLIDGSQGIYIPQQFANKYEEDPRWLGADQDDIDILHKGPEADGYWEAWEMVLNDTRYMDKDGREWSLWQDGDLFAYYGDGEQFT